MEAVRRFGAIGNARAGGASIAQSPSGPIRSFNGQFYTDFIGKGAHALATGMPAQSVRAFKTAFDRNPFGSPLLFAAKLSSGRKSSWKCLQSYKGSRSRVCCRVL